MQVGVQVTFTIIMSILFHRMLTLYLGGPYIRGPYKRGALYPRPSQPCVLSPSLPAKCLTGRMGWMAHRKWKQIKLQPSMLPGPAVPGSCFASFHFRWAIHPIRPVHKVRGNLCHMRQEGVRRTQLSEGIPLKTTLI